MGDALDIQRLGSALLNPELAGPHPSPLPEGEGTEWGDARDIQRLERALVNP